MKLSGVWEDGKIVKGKWIFPNGIYWEGNFNKNKPTGEGTWVFFDGNVVKGAFKQAEDEEAEPIPDTDEKPIKISWETKVNAFNANAFDILNI